MTDYVKPCVITVTHLCGHSANVTVYVGPGDTLDKCVAEEQHWAGFQPCNSCEDVYNDGVIDDFTDEYVDVPCGCGHTEPMQLTIGETVDDVHLEMCTSCKYAHNPHI